MKKRINRLFADYDGIILPDRLEECLLKYLTFVNCVYSDGAVTQIDEFGIKILRVPWTNLICSEDPKVVEWLKLKNITRTFNHDRIVSCDLTIPR